MGCMNTNEDIKNHESNENNKKEQKPKEIINQNKNPVREQAKQKPNKIQNQQKQSKNFDKMGQICTIQQIGFYQNDIRANPSKYAKKIQQQLSLFLDEYTLPLKDGLNYRTNEGQSAWKETIQFLKQQQPLPPMEAHSGLSLAAKAHANDLAHLDDISHTGTDGSTPTDRMKRFCEPNYGKSGENIGSEFKLENRNHAENTIIGLVIDDGVQSRGHRLSIFDKDFKYFGSHTVVQGQKIITVINYTSDYWKPKN